VEGAASKEEGWLASLLAPILFLFGATAVFAQLQGALNRIWRTKGPAAEEVAPPKDESTVTHATRIALAFVRIRLVSFGLVIGGGFLLTVSLAVNAVIVGLSKSWHGEVQALAPILWVLQLCVSLAVLTGLFAAIYKLLPDTRVDWIDVWTGGFITAVLFTIGKFAIGAYLASTDVASSYGAAGTIILILLWVYYSAQIFLYGAEVTWLWRQHRHARRRH
jgi:membrane protein